MKRSKNEWKKGRKLEKGKQERVKEREKICKREGRKERCEKRSTGHERWGTLLCACFARLYLSNTVTAHLFRLVKISLVQFCSLSIQSLPSHSFTLTFQLSIISFFSSAHYLTTSLQVSQFSGTVQSPATASLASSPTTLWYSCYTVRVIP